MSALLDSLCGPERLAEMARNEAPSAVAAAHAQWQAQRWAEFRARMERGEASYGRYGRTCSLCGDASDRQVCAGCNVGLTEIGL